MMLPTVRRYGSRSVWNVGLAVLGYPPTWITSGEEIFKLTEAIANGNAS